MARAIHNNGAFKVGSVPWNKGKSYNLNTLDRFWAKVVVMQNGCMERARAKSRPTFMFNGRPMKAYRFIWEATFGPIPRGLYVCHACDNPLCVNPKHLFVGTQKDNIEDAKMKGRFTGKPKEGKVYLRY